MKQLWTQSRQGDTLSAQGDTGEWFAKFARAHGVRSAKCQQFVYPACQLGIIVSTANVERVCMAEFKFLTCNYAKNIQV